jgi:hypothetical protein
MQQDNSTADHIMPKSEKFELEWGSTDSAATVVEHQSKSHWKMIFHNQKYIIFTQLRLM